MTDLPEDVTDTCYGYVCDICGKRLEGEPMYRFETFCTCPDRAWEDDE